MTNVLEGRRPGGYTRTLPSRIRSLNQLKFSFGSICRHLVRRELYAAAPVGVESNHEMVALRDSIIDELRCLRQELVALRGEHSLPTRRHSLHHAVLAASILASLFIPAQTTYPTNQNQAIAPLPAELIGFLTSLSQGEDPADAIVEGGRVGEGAPASSSLCRILSVPDQCKDWSDLTGASVLKSDGQGSLTRLAPQLLMLVFAFFNQLGPLNQLLAREPGAGASLAAHGDPPASWDDNRSPFLEATLLVASGDLVGTYQLLQNCETYSKIAKGDRDTSSSAVVAHALEISGTPTLSAETFQAALLARVLRCGLALQRTSLQHKEFLRGVGSSFRPKPTESDPPLPVPLMRYIGSEELGKV
jgi:hypothetical protein